MHAPPSNWLPSTPRARPLPTQRQKSKPFIALAIGIAIFFVVGQAISSCSPDSVSSEEEFSAPEQVGASVVPGPVQEEALVGTVWLPIPEGWGHEWITSTDGFRSLTLLPPDLPGASLHYSWQTEGPFFSDAIELCDSTASDFTADSLQSEIASSDEVRYGYADFDGVRCSALAFSEGPASAYRITALLDNTSSVSMIAVSQREADAPADAVFEAWDRYLGCIAAEQLDVHFDDCLE